MKKIFTYPFSFSFKTYKRSFLLFIIILLFSKSYTQNKKQFYIPDSLKNYTFQELFERQNIFKNDLNKLKIYSTAYLHKAKNENDTIKIANGYSQFASNFFINNPENAIKYYDSIINLTDGLSDLDYPGYGYLYKGSVQFIIGKYNKALENLLIAQKLATLKNNKKQHLEIKNQIGSIKLIWGNYTEAKKEFKYVLKNFDSINIPENFITIKHQSLYFLSYSYLKEKSFDSAYFYANKYFALEKDLGIKKAEFNYKELLSEIEYHKTNYKKTIKLLDEISVDDFYTTSFNYTFLYGSALNKLDRKEEAFPYFKQADSIYNSTNDLMPEVRMVQEFFIDYYKEKKDIKNQLKYINKLLYVDSIIDYNSKTLNETITKRYDTPLLIAEKEKIIHELNNHHKNYNLIIIILCGLFLTSSALIVNYKKKQKKLNKHIKSIENNSSKNKKIATKSTLGIESIPQNVIDSILNKLNSFEKNHLFLDNEIKLSSLAKSFNTNANYLSKVINHHKEKNFNTYLTDLRIDYCITKLKVEKSYRKYTIQAIAYEAGFNNAESFSKAFHKKTGVYPSNFIKELNKKLEI